MSQAAGQALEGFVAKWRAREPDMAQAEIFCPPPRRGRFQAWGALQHALREAVFELRDAHVGQAKSGWWAEELLALQRGTPRHPLTLALAGQGDAMRWSPLAGALIDSVAGDLRPAGRDAAFAGVDALARGIAETEAALFDLPGSDEEGVRAVAVHLLAQRLSVGLAAEDAGRVPMHLLARHGLTSAELGEEAGRPARRDWARELLAALPARLPRAPLYRRQRAAFDRYRLARLAAGADERAPGPLRGLLLAWNAARGGSR